MNFPYVMRWYAGGPEPVERLVSTSIELRRSFEIVTLETLYAEVVCEVDLVALNPRPAQPPLIRFLAGHPAASRVIIHGGGTAHFVRMPSCAEVSGEVLVVRRGHTTPADPRTMRVPADALYELIDSICTRNRLPGRAELVHLRSD
ncbi:hypothetical protein [Actinoplanes sp. NPDC048796]|uniref:hypothetical protein n=1 Tax=unclassified Actinoplanes TaxID=2626549 RepID=UPI003406332B